MGGLFGGGRKQEQQKPKKTVVTQRPDSAVDEDPRPMPDPELPAVQRAAAQERGRISRRSGRVSTDLTMRQRMFEGRLGMLGSGVRAVRPQSRSALGSI